MMQVNKWWVHDISEDIAGQKVEMVLELEHLVETQFTSSLRYFKELRILVMEKISHLLQFGLDYGISQSCISI